MSLIFLLTVFLDLSVSNQKGGGSNLSFTPSFAFAKGDQDISTLIIVAFYLIETIKFC